MSGENDSLAMKNYFDTPDAEPDSGYDNSDVEASKSTDEIFPLVYEELRRLARDEMTSERKNHTLQPTALVSEAYLRLVRETDRPWMNRAHFFGAAARALRRVLVDYAREKNRTKRGGERQRISLQEGSLGDLVGTDALSPDELIALDEALERLAKIDAAKARLVDLRFFSGLEVKEVARILGRSEASLARDWKFSKAWLHRELDP